MSAEGLREPSRETIGRKRRSPINGGTTRCSHVDCSEKRAKSSNYCPEHRNEAQRIWRAARTKLFHELMENAKCG